MILFPIKFYLLHKKFYTFVRLKYSFHYNSGNWVHTEKTALDQLFFFLVHISAQVKHFKAPFHISSLNAEARWNAIQLRAPGSSSACKSWLLQKVNCLIYIVLKSRESTMLRVQILHCVSHDSQRHEGYKCIWGGGRVQAPTCLFPHMHSVVMP